MTWVDEVVALFKVVIKVEPGVWGLGEFKFMGLVDKGASLNALNNNAKSSLLPLRFRRGVKDRHLNRV